MFIISFSEEEEEKKKKKKEEEEKKEGNGCWRRIDISPERERN